MTVKENTKRIFFISLPDEEGFFAAFDITASLYTILPFLGRETNDPHFKVSEVRLPQSSPAQDELGLRGHSDRAFFDGPAKK